MAFPESYNNNLSVEDLIKLAESDKDGGRITSIGEFVLEKAVKPSITSKVDGPIIYWVYLKWCKERKIVPLGRNKFFKELKTRFKHYRNDDAHQYWVEPEPFNISKEEWWKMRKAMRRAKQQRQKTKK